MLSVKSRQFCPGPSVSTHWGRVTHICVSKQTIIGSDNGLSVKSWQFCPGPSVLTHWGRVTQICVSKQTIIGSDNGLSPGRRQAIIWTNAGILLIGTFGTNFSEILIDIRIFSFKKMGLKMSSAKWQPWLHDSQLNDTWSH